MAFKLTDLPYADSALDPAVSAETLSYHHGKHHQAYVDKTNKAIEGTGHADKSLEEVIAAARGNDQGLFNNSAQAWNSRPSSRRASKNRNSSTARIKIKLSSFDINLRTSDCATR